jgi:hypothetical protein
MEKHRMMCACSSCGYISQCLMTITGCRKMHVTDQYVCDNCLTAKRLVCSQCGDSICDYAVFIQQNPDEPVPTWYTSWKEQGRNYI